MVKDVMNSPVITASPETNVKELAEKISKAKVGSVVIVENSKPVGIVSELDIVSKVAVRDEVPSKVLAKEIMQPLYTINGEELLTEAAKFMRKHNIKRLAVMYENKLAGIISSSDIISVTPELITVISEKASILRWELERTPTNYSGYCDECDEWSDYLQYTDGRFICEECRSIGTPGEIPPEHM